MNTCYASAILQSEFGSRDFRLRTFAVNIRSIKKKNCKTLNKPKIWYLKATLFYLRIFRMLHSFKSIVMHRNPSREPVDRERQIARGVLQSSDQTNRKLNWVLKSVDVITNGLSKQF